MSSLSAPPKLVPLSLQISLAAPRMQIKRRSAWMKASVSNDPTSSTCIALEMKQTKMQPYTFSVARPRFTLKEPKKSSLIKVNGGSCGTSRLREVPHHLVHDSFVPLVTGYATTEYPASEYTGVEDPKLVAQN